MLGALSLTCRVKFKLEGVNLGSLLEIHLLSSFKRYSKSQKDLKVWIETINLLKTTPLKGSVSLK